MALFDSKKDNLDVNNNNIKHRNIIDRREPDRKHYHKNINASQETVNKLKAFVWTHKADNVKQAVDYAIQETIKRYPEATRKEYFSALSDINRLENAKKKYK